MNPFLLAALLAGLVWALQTLERSGKAKALFHRLPVPFWCYFLPMTLSSLGVLPHQSPAYGFLTSYGLAACLILLLLSVDLPAIAHLGPNALSTMAVGVLGIALGAVTAFALWRHHLPPEAWAGLGALSASWTGGSANMIAVKESLGLSDTAFAPLIITDTLVTYGWMALLITLAPLQNRWDRWVNAEDLKSPPTPLFQRGVMDELPPSKNSPLWKRGVRGDLVLGVGALALAWLCLKITPSTLWALLVATALGIGLSFTPARRLESWGASQIGSFFLYVLLAAIGARASLSEITRAPWYLVSALTLAGVHATFLLAWGRWRRLPLFYLVSASQACFGGTASAPIVAGVYRPALAPVGLLLAVSANVIGTYVGLAVAHLCRSLP